MMRFESIKFAQDNIKMFLLKMTADQLLDSYEILHYDSATNTNYQRPPIPTHYRKIANYFLTESSPILPTAIVAAISSSNIEEQDGQIELKGKMRIVDGQHRIEGLKALKNEFASQGREKYETIKNRFEFPIILMIIEPKDEIVEIDAFININSKGKRVKTDLAETLKSKKRELALSAVEFIPVNEQLISDIALGVCRKLNTDSDSFWKDLIIQADEIGNRNEQPITVITFMQAIKPVIALSLQGFRSLGKNDMQTQIFKVSSLLLHIWDKVMDKWPGCFNGEKRTYDKAYNICKGLGVIPLLQIYCNQNNKTEETIDAFADVLAQSKVREEDWLVGGNFTGLSSGQGKATIRKYICGEIESIYEV